MQKRPNVQLLRYTVLCKLSVFLYTCYVHVCVCVCVCACFDRWEHQHMFSICTAGARRIEFSLSLSKKAEGLEKVAKPLSKNSTQKCFFK